MLNPQTNNINSINFSSVTINNSNNSKYSSETTVNRNNSINCHNSSYIEDMLRNHHEEIIYNDNENNEILGNRLISHDDLLDNYDADISSSNQKNLTQSYESSINRRLNELMNNENEYNDQKSNLQTNPMKSNDNNNVCREIENGGSKEKSPSNNDIKDELSDTSEFVNICNYFFNNKDIMLDSNIPDYGNTNSSPKYDDLDWNVNENYDFFCDDYSSSTNNYNSYYNDSCHNSSDYYCPSDNDYKSSNSETFSINKYKEYTDFKLGTNNCSRYCLNKDEKLKTDSQIMLFPEIAKQMKNNEKINVYNKKLYSINSSTDDCSSILNNSSSKLPLYYQKDLTDNQSIISNSGSRILNNNNNNDNSSIFSDRHSSSVLHLTRSNSAIINNGINCIIILILAI